MPQLFVVPLMGILLLGPAFGQSSTEALAFRGSAPDAGAARPGWAARLGLPAGALPEPRRAQDQEVVVYVSLDEEHSRRILDIFEERTGITVKDNYDTEANKTVGLVNKIIAERASPVADVYWNNECGQTERLEAMGLLEPYVSPGAAGIPATFKDPEGSWTGFAARARVLVWNRDLVKKEDLPARLEDLADPRFRGKIAMARPLTGTTLTHMGALYAMWGEERTNAWLERLRGNDLRWEAGNAQVALVVSEGTRPMGMTDTDDVRVKQLEGLPVEAHFLDQGEGDPGTLVIPNSVMILKGARHPEAARRLVDFLVSPEVEQMLAEGRSAQMPLHPGVPAPDHVVPLEKLKAMDVDFGRVGAMIEAHKEKLAEMFGTAPAGGGAPGEERGGASTTLVLALGALLLVIVFVWMAFRPRRTVRRNDAGT